MWFRRKKSVPAYRVPDPDDDSWIMVPFRFAEAARVSIHTIGSSTDIPGPIRWWISQWLTAYNSQLVFYMRENYGPDIFPILDRITADVMPGEQSAAQGSDDSWEKWEGQFREDDR
jgi:hypothetical protein